VRSRFLRFVQGVVLQDRDREIKNNGVKPPYSPLVALIGQFNRKTSKSVLCIACSSTLEGRACTVRWFCGYEAA
jgi:hypothetical protein